MIFENFVNKSWKHWKTELIDSDFTKANYYTEE